MSAFEKKNANDLEKNIPVVISGIEIGIVLQFQGRRIVDGAIWFHFFDGFVNDLDIFFTDSVGFTVSFPGFDDFVRLQSRSPLILSNLVLVAGQYLNRTHL